MKNVGWTPPSEYWRRACTQSLASLQVMGHLRHVAPVSSAGNSSHGAILGPGPGRPAGADAYRAPGPASTAVTVVTTLLLATRSPRVSGMKKLFPGPEFLETQGAPLIALSSVHFLFSLLFIRPRFHLQLLPLSGGSGVFPFFLLRALPPILC